MQLGKPFRVVSPTTTSALGDIVTTHRSYDGTRLVQERIDMSGPEHQLRRARRDAGSKGKLWPGEDE